MLSSALYLVTSIKPMRAVEKVQGRSRKKLASETYVIRTRASFLKCQALIFFYGLTRILGELDL